jgi:hypothetical protein
VVSEAESTPPPVPALPEGPRVSGRRRRAAWRWTRRLLALVAAILATVLVSLFTIDLGRLFPQLKPLAEREASKYLDRPMHIGRLRAMLSPGDFVLENVVIEGRSPSDRPFFKADRIYVHVPWWTVFRRRVIVEVELTDWEMVVESWPGRHNVPRFRRPAGGGNSGISVTVPFVYAKRGKFTYDDHGTPWKVVAPNLSFELARSASENRHVGKAQFTGGTVQIQNYRPMATEMATRFYIDGGLVKLQHIDLITDGSRSHVNGVVDFARWPEQTYNVNSTVNFPRMKEIFFANEPWRLAGEGEFSGVFKLFKDGRELTGEFRSDTAAVNALSFDNLHGSLLWTPTRFAVTHAEAGLMGGETRFEYSLAPLGTRTGATATFKADYQNVDLFDLDRLLNLRGLRMVGLASGSLDMQWPNGKFGSGRRGRGHTFFSPPEGVELAPDELPAEPLPVAIEPRPFEPNRRLGTLTIGGDLHYAFDPEGITFDDSWAATRATFVRFSGRMGAGASEFPFHVTSHDWQESDRLLAGIMTAVSGPTGAVEVSGRGTFDGTMTGTFSRPRIEGHFAGESTRVWDVTWGDATGDIVIQNGYVDITNSRIGDDQRLIAADGRFALGFRRDQSEEIRARVMIRNWPVADLRHAFRLDDWPMDGIVAEARLELSGQYRRMFGSGPIRVTHGQAWGEGFDEVTGEIGLEGDGMRISRIEMRKGPGVVHGAARIGWDGTYAFNADGEAIAVESLDRFKMPQAPLSGRLRFKVSGASEFDRPLYTFEGAIDDLFVADEGIGSVTGRMTVSNGVMTIERLLAASSRLQTLATGTVALDERWTSDLRFRFQQTAIDPYLKFVLADDISPYTRAVVGGSLNVKGPLGYPDALSVEAAISDVSLTLYDYALRNDGPVAFTFSEGLFRIGSLRLSGSDTNLELAGGANTLERTWDLSANGDASLSILQLFYRNLTASGGATLNASLLGSFDAPRLSGAATLIDGRLRPFDSPHSLEALSGRIAFGAAGISLEEVTGRVASGEVTFGGTIPMEGYRPTEFNLTARGRSMRLRYPAGFSSTVDMDLFLTGELNTPRLSGTIDVLRMAFIGATGGEAGLLGFATGGGAVSGTIGPPAPTVGNDSGVALDIQVTAPRMAVINNREARIEATADLQVRGTFDRPQIVGAIEIAGGEFLFNGNRFYVREGSIEFSDPNRLNPSFDLAAETRPRVSGQTFTVNARVTGTRDALDVTLTSDPWLPESDVISLLFGGTPELGTAEQRALRSSQELQQRMVQTVGAYLLANPLTERVGAVVERTGALDTVQITPVLANETAFQQLDPGARITLGKRISPRVFLTYSRTLNNSSREDEIILLEYDQSDRVSWVLSRNDNRTFALDFRIRYVF